jgi:hypothetical protein
LVEKIVAETNAYAVRCIQVRPDKVWVPTTFPEMMAFLGIHVVFSIVGIPSYTLAWKSSWPFVPLQSLLLPLYQYKFGIRGNIHSVGRLVPKPLFQI